MITLDDFEWLFGQNDPGVPDRKGRLISTLAATHLKYQVRGYDRVANTRLELDGRSAWVSTVWLGPIWPYKFETMIFSEVEVLSNLERRWRTLRAAEIGHRRVVRLAKTVLCRPAPLARPHRHGHW